MAAAEEQDIVLKVTLNNIHRFLVVIAKKSSIADLKTEITKVSRLLLSSVDLGEITSLQTCSNHELPDIYKVGRLLKEGDSILAFSSSHLSNHTNSTFNEEDTGGLEHSQNLQSQKSIRNKSDTTDISQDFLRENSRKNTEVLAESCYSEQECSSKRKEKEDMNKRNNPCKDSDSRKERTKKLKTRDFVCASSCNAEQEYLNKRNKNKTVSAEDGHKSSGCTKEQPRNQTQDLEDTSRKKNEEITDKIAVHESVEQREEAEDRNYEGRSLGRLNSKRREPNLQRAVINNEVEHQSTMQCQENIAEDYLSKQSSTKILSVDENHNDKHESMNFNTEQEDTASDNEFFTCRKLKLKKKPQKIQNIRNIDDSKQDLTNKGEKQHKIQDDDEKDVISEDFSLKNGETKNKKLEIQTTRNESYRDETTEDEEEDIDNANVDTNGENPRNRAQNFQKKKTVFQMENFILQSEEENCESRASDDQNDIKSRTTNMRTKKGVFNKPTCTSNIERIEKNACSKDPAEEKKISRRKWKRSRTQSVDESLADEDLRNRPSESPSTGSQPSSIVSESVLKSQAFKTMLETTGCFSQRRRQAIEKSVTKVATWLVDHNEDVDDDETPITLERMSTEVLDNTVHCVKDALNHDAQDDDSPDVYYEDVSRIYPIIDVLPDRVLYYDSDPSDASSSGGLIKETQLLSCRVVIPKLNLTQPVLKGIDSSCSASEPQSIPPEVIPTESNVAKKAEEEPVAGDCQDMNEEDFGYGSRGIIESSGSEELFPASPKLKHMMSYTNELLPSNMNKSLEHSTNEKEDDSESCLSTEILDSEEKAHGDQHSLPEKLRLPLNVEGVTANQVNQTGENEHHGQEGENSQESSDKILKDDTNLQVKMICEEAVDKSHVQKNGTERRDTEYTETTEDYLTVTNDRSKKVCLSSPKKKKSRESRESTVTNVGDGSVSESGMHKTSTNENDAQEKKTSKESRNQETVHSEDNRAEDSEQLMSIGRKKKEKRNRNRSPAKSRNNDNSIQEDSEKLRSVIPESLASSPRKGFANTDLPFQGSLVNLSTGVTSSPEKLSKERSLKHHKKGSFKNKDPSAKALTVGSHDNTDSDDEFQTCSESSVTTSKEKDQESVTEEKSFENKAKKKKKKEKDNINISAEDTSERKDKPKKDERLKTNEECSFDKEEKITSFDLPESTALCVNEEENSEGMKRKKEKKKRRYKTVKDETVDICEEDATKKSSKAGEGFEEEEATNKPVEPDKPVLTSAKAKHDSDETEKEGKRTRDKTKKGLKRKKKVENNDMNKEAEDMYFAELPEEIPKKKRKKSQKVCEEKSKASLKGSDMFTSCSESESNIGVTDVLSWISNKMNNQTIKKSSTKKTNKSALLDLAQEDQELNAHKTPTDSCTSVFTPRPSSTRSQIFLKTPTGFTNTVPRLSKKLKLTTQTVASSRRKRKLSKSPPQSRELTREEKDMLSGGVNRLEELLDDDSFWD